MKQVIFPLLTLFVVSACGNGNVDEPATEVTAATPQTSVVPPASMQHTVKPTLPVTIEYKIIGSPIVGQPVAVNLEVKSALGPQAITLSYRINDATAMQFYEAQPASVSIAPSNADAPSVQEVRVVPMREGRLFLNVTAIIETDDGSMSTVMAVPIQVGAARRQVQQNGEVMTDENGELIHSLPASED